MAPGRIGPDAPSSRWKLLDRSDHHSSGRTDFNRDAPCATASGGSIATRLRPTPFGTGVRPVLHAARQAGIVPTLVSETLSSRGRLSKLADQPHQPALDVDLVGAEDARLVVGVGGLEC